MVGWFGEWVVQYVPPSGAGVLKSMVESTTFTRADAGTFAGCVDPGGAFNAAIKEANGRRAFARACAAGNKAPLLRDVETFLLIAMADKLSGISRDGIAAAGPSASTGATLPPPWPACWAAPRSRRWPSATSWRGGS